MTPSGRLPLVIVGSVALDTIRTREERRSEVLGGSCSYACLAAACFSPVGMVGVVGTDFPPRAVRLYRRGGIDTAGLQVAKGRTFRWSGLYEEDMNSRRTLRTDLNVFAAFRPELPAIYRSAPLVFLANIAPELQTHVLDQVDRPRFVAADTMDLWIRTARPALDRVLARIDLVLVNDSEARLLTGESLIVRAAEQILDRGPRFVIVKKGEHGALLFSRTSVFAVPAFPVDRVRDPTGAGDTFAGGMMGCLASAKQIGFDAVRRGMLYGTVMASFCVEDFSVNRVVRAQESEVRARLCLLRQMMSPPA